MLFNFFKMLEDRARELGMDIDRPGTPPTLADELFSKVMEATEDNDEGDDAEQPLQ
ncbi:MAG: hypothetical protein BMS9Abin34_116 [Patescibacteria group bacterium]|nr:MAG: hypothetical protein BMS9Abin34_116 [Patescibacteria group bacterium]